MRAETVIATVEQLGCRVFPVRPDRKAPAITAAYELATTDPEQIEEWWAVWPGPRSRIGVPMDGLTALDFDVGTEARVGERFAEEFGDLILPRAYRQRTRSGGAHIVCRASPSLDKQLTKWRDYGAAGSIDIKAGRSFILVDPSPGYEFAGGVRSLRPHDLQEWPEHVAEALRIRSSAKKTKPAAPSFVPGWRDMTDMTRHYKPWPLTRRLLFKDCQRIATATNDVQEETLSRAAFVWGMKVRSGYISAEHAFERLTAAGTNMTNYDPVNPWRRSEIEWRVQRAMIRGFAAGKGKVVRRDG